jgi:hypothetical protein
MNCDCKNNNCKNYIILYNLYPKINYIIYNAYKNGDNSVTITIPRTNQKIIFDNIQQNESFCDFKKEVIKTVYKANTNIILLTIDNKTYFSPNGKTTICIRNEALTQNFYEYGINNNLSVKINDTSTILLKY